MGEDDWPGLDSEDSEEPDQQVAAKPKAGPKPRGTPKGSRVAEGPGAKLARKGGFLFAPVSPLATRQAVFWGHQGLAVAAGSREELHESDPDVEAAGDSLYRLTEMVPVTRALVHAAPALVFVGAEASLLRRIFAACPPGSFGHRVTHRRQDVTRYPGYKDAYVFQGQEQPT